MVGGLVTHLRANSEKGVWGYRIVSKSLRQYYSITSVRVYSVLGGCSRGSGNVGQVKQGIIYVVSGEF